MGDFVSAAVARVLAGDGSVKDCSCFAVVAALCVLCARSAVGWRGRRLRRRELLQLAGRKRDARDALRGRMVAEMSIQPFADIEDGARIVSLTASEMLREMGAGTLTSERLVTACCARAILAAEQLTCTAEEMYADAIKEARLCDAERAKGKLRGPLHGLPFSVKDQVNVKGYDSTCGLACRVFKPADASAVAVQVWVDAGAIPFVRSNVPQCLMLPESMNAIWGFSRNPFNALRTPGGSSGGEGALIGSRASPLGIGTDIGGSIRIPSAFCGIVGLKPTPQRMSQVGVSSEFKGGVSDGNIAILPTLGPMARSVEDVELAMRVWCSAMPQRDPMLPKLGWNSQASSREGTRRLRFGVLRYDSFFPPAAPYGRALDSVVAGLKADGHDVVEVTYDLRWNVRMFIAILAAEGEYRGMVEGLEGEEMHDNYKFLYNVACLPDFVKTLLVGVLGVIGDERMRMLVDAGRKRSVFDYKGLIAERDREVASFIRYLRAHEIDSVLSPGVSLPAFRHRSSKDLAISCSYTFLWNNLNFPTGTVPVTYVRKEEETYTPCEEYKDKLEAQAKGELVGATGLPVAVQVSTLPFEEEQCVYAMYAVEKAAEATWTAPHVSDDLAFVKQFK